MARARVRRFWPALLVAIGLLAGACTDSSAATSAGAGSNLSEEVKQLPATFYQGATAEPGADFNLDAVRSVTADPLQTAVVADLERLAAVKSPNAYFRYRDVQVLGGSCSGQGNNRLCELRVQRVYDRTDEQGTPQGAANDVRIFRARQVDGKWRLTDTHVEGQWLQDGAESGAAAPAG